MTQHVRQRREAARVQISRLDACRDDAVEITTDRQAQRAALAGRNLKRKARARAELMHGIWIADRFGDIPALKEDQIAALNKRSGKADAVVE